MAKFPFDIVLFDLDGTLVDSNLDLGPAINHALSLEDRPALPLAEVRQLIGGGAIPMLERGLERTGGAVSQERFDELSQALLEHYWAHIADNTQPFQGVLGALDTLAGMGCKLAVCTNKAEDPARQLIEALGMTERFCAIHGGDTFGREKAKPDPTMLLSAIEDCGGGKAAMIGDSTYDVRAARNAGIPVVTYRYGYHDVPVDELGGDAMIDHFDELVSVLEDL
ncbi:HAD-IA family hydrolase [Aurantiacibacter poecillastricola]|uniref:HAD-IA family hydrolase n=1 Tax=Aurantiacibacter poecillastricola TaxID=3064385 RepID=UPI00273FC592|nr:HAD-IA family hydrolase [Aurantiacibacter sp. 219JJ12-13]MDP5262478.1 HAD-IA family hydrolase [Aurantiacibacter sp. 219JJ12-13]